MRIPNFREMTAVKGLGHFRIILVVSRSWVIILRLDSLGLIEHFGLFPHRKGRSAMRPDSVLHFNAIPGDSRIPQSLCIDVRIKHKFLRDKPSTSLLVPIVIPLAFSLLTSKIVLSSYLELDGELARSMVKSYFLPYPMPAPESFLGIFYLP